MSDFAAHGHVLDVEVPSSVLTALEVRAVAERVSMWWLTPWLRQLPKGDGHSVLFLPGFTSSDRATKPMRDLFYQLGYRTYRWRLGTNKGPTERIVPGLRRLAERVISRADGPISIVGWSLGGIYAREIARQHPDDVRQVITLGSPIQMAQGDPSAVSGVWERFDHRHVEFGHFHHHESLRPSLEMPRTSVFTRTDGIIDWRTSLIPETDHSQNVEVWGSHSGLGFNATALAVVADRLAQPLGEWKRYKVPLALRGAFPPQRTW